MTFVWQSALGVIFTFALYAPIVNSIGPRPQPMIVRPAVADREDDEDGGPDGGLRVVRAPGAQKRTRGCHIRWFPLY